MKHFVEMVTYEGETEVIIRIAPEENSSDGAELLAWEIYSNAIPYRGPENGVNFPKFQLNYTFFNDLTDRLVVIRVAAYGELAQVREGVFKL